MIVDQWPDEWTERIERLDWSDSPLGHPEGWSIRLKTALGILFSSAAPKVVLWGDEFRVFFNDAFIDLAGGRVGIGDTGKPLPLLMPRAWNEIETDVRKTKRGMLRVQSKFVLPPVNPEEEGHYYTVYHTPMAEPNGTIDGVLIDIHARMPSRLLDSLLLSENSQLNRLLNDSPAYIALAAGPEMKLEFVNRAAAELFGRPDQLDGEAGSANRAGRWLKKLLREVYTSGVQQNTTGFPFASLVGNKAGQNVEFIDFVCQPVRDDGSHAFGVIFTGFDVTKRTIAQRESDREHHRQLHHSRLEAMGTMAMTLAHELNQPLAAVSNYLNAVQRLSIDPDGNAIPLLESAQQEIQRAGNVIRRARSLVRLGVAERTAISLRGACSNAIRLLEASGCDDVHLTLDLADDATHVLVDEVQFEQVLVNLFRNSANASNQHTLKEVAVSARRMAGNRIRLEVRDFGTGFQPERLISAIDKTNDSSSEGLGVGLALSRTLLEANRASIEFGNADSGGAVVVIELDAAECPN
ncbi:ATP-binding protein [Novosphingobium sp. ZN18A2]|uniref:ATP-binding protein n=1 Tax=Novosphingobium sp. ZN18A2 TaxID=3079861 RepID=UPI0030CC2B3A